MLRMWQRISTWDTRKRGAFLQKQIQNTYKDTYNMKLTKIEVSCTFNAGNYESVKLGGEWEIESGEEIGSAMQNAMNAVRCEWERIKAAKVEINTPQEKTQQNEEKAAKSGKTLVEFGSPLLQKIVDRIMADKSVTLEVITTHD